MTPHDLAEAAGLALLATCNVGLWTLRVAVAAAGRRLVAAGIAGAEALLFALVFGAVISSLDHPLRVVAYAAGVALGTVIGVVADERLSTGQSLVRIIVDGGDPTLALRERGWPATCSRADGVRGPVAVLVVAVDDRRLSHLLSDIEHLAPEGFLTVERLRSTKPVALPRGYMQVRSRR